MRLWTDKRYQISITRLGLEYITVMLLLGLLAVNTGNNLLYVVFSLMLSFFGLSSFLSQGAISKLLPSQVYANDLFARIKGHVNLEIHNRAPHRLRALTMRLETQDGFTSPVFFPGGEAQEYTQAVFPVRPHERGLCKFKHLECQTSYPFGFTTKLIRLPINQELLVFPYPRSTTLVPELKGDSTKHPGKRGTTSPEGARPFKRGDSRSRIYWKRTAQRGFPWVRTFEGEESLGVHLFLDLQAWQDGDDFENELERLAGAILQAKIQKHPVALEIKDASARKVIHGATPAWAALALAKPQR